MRRWATSMVLITLGTLAAALPANAAPMDRSAEGTGVLDGDSWAADVDGDRRADQCRLQGNENFVDSRVYCDLAAGGGVISGVLDWGYREGRAMVDFNGDGKADYCRVRGTQNFTHAFATCTLSTGRGFGSEINSPALDWGYPEGRHWADVDGNRRADFCRTVGNAGQTFVQCRLSAGTAFAGEKIV